MQNDLISRSALMKYLRDYKWEFAMGSDFSKAMEMIDAQPTAYDVEKVVQCIHKYFTKKINDCKENIVPHEILEYNKVICEIVKNGGVE